MGARVRDILGRQARRSRRIFGRDGGRKRGRRTIANETLVERTTTLPHPPERVWRALTDRAALDRWLLPASGDIPPTVGHRFSFAGDGGERVDCAVVEAVPNRRLAYTWQRAGDARPSRVAWTLEPIEGGTRLHLRHDAPSFPTGGMMGLSACLAGGTRHRALHRRFRRRAARLVIGPPRRTYIYEGALLCR